MHGTMATGGHVPVTVTGCGWKICMCIEKFACRARNLAGVLTKSLPSHTINKHFAYFCLDWKHSWASRC